MRVAKASRCSPFENGIELFIVSGQVVEAGGSGEDAFDYPLAGQQRRAVFGHGMHDNLEP
jgi:hypothetical protein